ncbi:MAG: molecular chaperone DnaJ [Edafosvirus sp.]|uniref:Molecular chaperone DnaJ n=1 Tax=Edafosvirus sp. TaxID=2487765 RepID=A0A3G5A065_9VIRU|nr:MAG: molecular chaperone DnaJ [Edafosvirus sp.]
MSSNNLHYETLNLPKNASVEDIRKSYRDLAKIWHPDKNADINAPEQFKKISEAYQILSDPTKRMQYDNGMMNNFNQPMNFTFINPFNLFNNFNAIPSNQFVFNMQPAQFVFNMQPAQFMFVNQQMNNGNSNSYSKNVKITIQNGQAYQEITEITNGNKKTTIIHPDGTVQTILPNDDIKKLNT